MNSLSTKWGPITVSVLVILVFLTVFTFLAFRLVPDGETVKQLLVGLLTQVQAVISYWLGSSAGSKAKDQVISDQAKSPQG